MILTSTDDFIKDIKMEIRDFSDRIDIDEFTPLKSEIIYIIKQYYFIKSILEEDFDRHYVRELNMDILMTIHSLFSQHSLRNFHYNYRSLLENLTRVALEFDDSNETGVNELFRQFKDYCGTKQFADIYELISNEYGNSCFYVHSNIKRKTSFIEYISELDSFDDLSKERRKIVRGLVRIFESIVKILIENRYYTISQKYKRKNAVINYLISKANSQYYLLKQE